MPLVFQTDFRSLFILNVLTAFCYAFVLPVMMVFLVQGLGIAPGLLGLYTVGVALSGIAVAQWFGRLADTGVSGKALFMTGILALMTATFAYAWLTSFWWVLFIGITVMSVGNSAVPMLLTLIRHRINQAQGSATAINAQMRAGVSLVWVLGPATAFLLVDQVGFKATFLTAAGCCVVVLIAAALWLPDLSKPTPRSKEKSAVARPAMTISLLALGGMLLLGNAANGLYTTAMPLYLIRELNTPASLPGLLLGLTAAVELPVMLLTPRWAARTGMMPVLGLGFIAAILYYCGMYWMQDTATLVALQLLNGLFFGIFVGLGLTVVQDRLSHHPGFATAYYTSAIRVGSMVGTTMAGLLGQYLGFHRALLGSFGLALGALALLYLAWLTRHSSTAKGAPIATATTLQTERAE